MPECSIVSFNGPKLDVFAYEVRTQPQLMLQDIHRDSVEGRRIKRHAVRDVDVLEAPPALTQASSG